MMTLLLAYLGFGGGLTLPPDGFSHSVEGGPIVRIGAYVSDNVALEGAVSWADDAFLLDADALIHASAIPLYDRFFGYSAFDPFMTIGARGTVGAREAWSGPRAGLGAFYHLTDSWSLRGEVEVTLDLDARQACFYTGSLGVQYTF